MKLVLTCCMIVVAAWAAPQGLSEDDLELPTTNKAVVSSTSQATSTPQDGDNNDDDDDDDDDPDDRRKEHRKIVPFQFHRSCRDLELKRQNCSCLWEATYQKGLEAAITTATSCDSESEDEVASCLRQIAGYEDCISSNSFDPLRVSDDENRCQEFGLDQEMCSCLKSKEDNPVLKRAVESCKSQAIEEQEEEVPVKVIPSQLVTSKRPTTTANSDQEQQGAKNTEDSKPKVSFEDILKRSQVSGNRKRRQLDDERNLPNPGSSAKNPNRRRVPLSDLKHVLGADRVQQQSRNPVAVDLEGQSAFRNAERPVVNNQQQFQLAPDRLPFRNAERPVVNNQQQLQLAPDRLPFRNAERPAVNSHPFELVPDHVPQGLPVVKHHSIIEQHGGLKPLAIEQSAENEAHPIPLKLSPIAGQSKKKFPDFEADSVFKRSAAVPHEADPIFAHGSSQTRIRRQAQLGSDDHDLKNPFVRPAQPDAGLTRKYRVDRECLIAAVSQHCRRSDNNPLTESNR